MLKRDEIICENYREEQLLTVLNCYKLTINLSLWLSEQEVTLGMLK